MPDHVHMLISIPPKYAVSQVVGYIKGKSAIHFAGRLLLLKGLDNFSILRVCQGYVMQGKNRYFRRSHLWEAKLRALIRYFAHNLRA